MKYIFTEYYWILQTLVFKRQSGYLFMKTFPTTYFHKLTILFSKIDHKQYLCEWVKGSRRYINEKKNDKQHFQKLSKVYCSSEWPL